MKKIIALTIGAVAVLGLSACSKTETTSNETTVINETSSNETLGNDTNTSAMVEVTNTTTNAN